MNGGFYIPGSISSPYVAGKRDELGSFVYEGASSRIGIEKQEALQGLGRNYASTIENAYASYLASQQAIQSSQMGQGFKEAYLRHQQQQLVGNIGEIGSSMKSARSEIEGREQEAQAALTKQFETETGYLDRVGRSLGQYLDYIKNLTGEDGVSSYLTEEQAGMTVDELYLDLLRAEPQNYLDEEGNKALRYLDWVEKNLKETSLDQEWYRWLMGGGYTDFEQAVKTLKLNKRTTPLTTEPIIHTVGGYGPDDTPNQVTPIYTGPIGVLPPNHFVP